MINMKIFLEPYGRGALASGYREKDAGQDVYYLAVLDIINKARNRGEEKIHVEIRRDKLEGIKEALEKDGFDVVASID